MAETFEAFENFIEGNAPDQFLVRQGVKCAVRTFVGCTSHCLDELVKKVKAELAKAYEETEDVRYHKLRQMIPDFEKSKSGLWAAFVRKHLAEKKQEAKKKREDNRTLREAKKRKQEEEKGLEAALSRLLNGVAVEAAEQSAQPEETRPDGVAVDGDDTTDSFCGALVPPELSALSEESPPLEGEGQECGNDGSAFAPSSPAEPSRDQISAWLDEFDLLLTYGSGQEEEYDTDGGSHPPAVLVHLQYILDVWLKQPSSSSASAEHCQQHFVLSSALL